MQTATGVRQDPALFKKTSLGLILSALFFPPLAIAAPQGGQVVSGAAAISQSGNVTQIDQSTQKAAINWQGFSVGANEKVNFNQPNASSVTLNRVIGNERSVIEGALSANGQIFLINSNGVLFAKGSSVSAAGLVASTLNLSDKDFNAGRYVFEGSGAGAIVNQGSLKAADGGYVALLGRNVSNDGAIIATKGTVALGSGEKISLNFNGDSLLSVTLDEGALNALVENKGAIQADGGRVVLTARAADELLGSQVNNSGIVQARTLDDLKGDIVAYAYGGTARIGGVLDASAPNGGGGGTIETSGVHVKIEDLATITTKAANGTTGTWTVDPDGYTVGAGGDIGGATLGRMLDSNNVVLASTSGSGADGNINVNEAVSWAAGNKLTLTATKDIAVNAPINATGAAAGVVLNYGGDYRIDTGKGASITLSGANASLSINGNTYKLIHTMTDLVGIADASGTAAGYYALANNLDAAGVTYSGPVVSKMTGTLAGLGHTVSNLSITSTLGSLGLIGTLGSTTTYGTAVARDIGLVNVKVQGTNSIVGGLVGWNYGTISNAYVEGGAVSSTSTLVGGLAGLNWGGNIVDSHASVAVSGRGSVGGLVGQNGNITQSGTVAGRLGVITRSYATGTVSVVAYPSSSRTGFGGLAGLNNGIIQDSYATGNVTATGTKNNEPDLTNVGGLVGNNTPPLGTNVPAGGGTIIRSYATGSVTSANDSLGGLVGYNGGGKIADSYATGAVTSMASGSSTAFNGVGGLVGTNTSLGTNVASISGSHATGVVTAANISNVGGLAGYNGSTISNSYATGDVTGKQQVGGLVGWNSGSVTDAYALGNVTGAGQVGGLVGMNSTGNSVTTATIGNSYATGNVSGGLETGGLVGRNLASGSIAGSYASGNVSGSQSTGGLAGFNQGRIDQSYATGNVTGVTDVGGLVGWNHSDSQGTGTISNSNATGSVTGGADDGDKLVGNNTGTVTNSTYRDVAAEAAARAAAELRARVADASVRSASLVNTQQRDSAGLVPPPVFAQARPAIDSHIVYAPTQGYSADVNTITVDGVKFDLEDDAAKAGKGNAQGGAR